MRSSLAMVVSDGQAAVNATGSVPRQNNSFLKAKKEEEVM